MCYLLTAVIEVYVMNPQESPEVRHKADCDVCQVLCFHRYFNRRQNVNVMKKINGRIKYVQCSYIISEITS